MWLSKCKLAISKLDFLKKRLTVTLDGTNIFQVFVLHRVVQKLVQDANISC